MNSLNHLFTIFKFSKIVINHIDLNINIKIIGAHFEVFRSD